MIAFRTTSSTPRGQSWISSASIVRIPADEVVFMADDEVFPDIGLPYVSVGTGVVTPGAYVATGV